MKLWKENSVYQEYELSHKEIAERFLESPFNDPEKNSRYPLDILIGAFIGSPFGLHSTFNRIEETSQIAEICRQSKKLKI